MRKNIDTFSNRNGSQKTMLCKRSQPQKYTDSKINLCQLYNR